MKRFIALLLLLAIAILSLASCAKERYDALYVVDQNDLTFSVRGSGTRAKQITVKHGEELLWAKKISVKKDVGSMGGHYGFEVVDLNFDGNNDFMIVNEVAGECLSYLCFLWDAEKQDYIQSKELTGLCNVKADAERKSVFGFTHTYETEEAYADVPASSISTDAATKYVWNEGVLTPEIRVSITYYSETNRYLYSVAYYQAETQSWSEAYDVERWFTPEEYTEQDMSFLYYFK